MVRLVKPVIFFLALIPFVWLLSKVFQNDLGPDPAQALSIETGEWTLRFLLLTLAITPFRQIFRMVEIARLRRMIGLFTFFYASIHFLSWMAFILGFRWLAIAEELVERPYITVGFLAYVILFLLGVTSTNSMVRRLGKNWKRLHKFVYAASILAIVHLLWILRTDVTEAVIYGVLLAILLGYRIFRKLKFNFA
ncbi:MAG: sulfite oxidase heme-binding subunit YedZ [Pseudohongiellaceae bacterium]